MTPAGLQRMRYMLSDYVLLNLGWFTFNVVRYYSLPADWAGPIGGFLLLPSVILGQCVLPLLAIAIMMAVSTMCSTRRVYRLCRRL